MENFKLIPIREMEVIEDEMLNFITAGSLSVIAACNPNDCESHHGNCNGSNLCKTNTGDCTGINKCGDNEDSSDKGDPGENPGQGNP